MRSVGCVQRSFDGQRVRGHEICNARAEPSGKPVAHATDQVKVGPFDVVSEMVAGTWRNQRVTAAMNDSRRQA